MATAKDLKSGLVTSSDVFHAVADMAKSESPDDMKTAIDFYLQLMLDLASKLNSQSTIAMLSPQIKKAAKKSRGRGARPLNG